MAPVAFAEAHYTALRDIFITNGSENGEVPLKYPLFFATGSVIIHMYIFRPVVFPLPDREGNAGNPE